MATDTEMYVYVQSGMAVTMTLTEARASLPHVLDLVEAGEKITITRHGKPVAVVVPPVRLRNEAVRELFAHADALGRRLEEAAKRPIRSRPMSDEVAEDLLRWVEEGREEDEGIEALYAERPDPR